jgi:hypothetical protein
VGSSSGDLGRLSKRALEVDHLTLCGSCVRGTWREGSLAGDREGYVEKALETGISSHRGPTGNLLEGLSTGP